jgi:RND family efflux transporter MFP subunit
MQEPIARARRVWSGSIAFLAALVAATGSPQAGIDEALDCVIDPKSIVELGTAEQGILTEVLVKRGDVVAVGDEVAKLDSVLESLQVKLMKLRASSDVDIRSSEAKLEFRRSESERVSRLHTKKIVSTKNRDEVLIERDLAGYALESAELDREMAMVEKKQAEARLARRTVHTPVAGVVMEVIMTPGEYAYEQASIARIAEINPLYVEVFVPIKYYGQVRAGGMAEVYPEAPIGGKHLAKITVVDRVFDAASRTFGVRLELDNEDHGLPAGLRCRVRFLDSAAAMLPDGKEEPATQ